MKTRYSTTAASLLIVIAHLSSAQVVVGGVVTDPSGRPATDAAVQAMPRSTERADIAVGSASKWVKVDGEGRFSIKLLPGRYKIEAKDEAAGYPDPVFALSTDPTATFPTIVVGVTELSGIRVVLGNRGGTVEGNVVDRSNQAPVANAKITISDLGNAQTFVEVFTDKLGGFNFTVPNKPIRLTATASGYSPLTIIGDDGMTLASGERRNFVVEMERSK